MNSTQEKLTLYDIKIIALSIVIALTSAFGVDMHLPALPEIVNDLHTTNGMGQASVSIYLLGLLTVQLFFGPWSDKIGRKPVILFGISIAVIGSLICYAANNIGFFLLGRLIQGIGAAAGMSLCRSIISDTLSQYKMSAYGSYASVFITIGIMVAPLIGAYFTEILGWRSVFLAMLVFFGLTGLLVLRSLPETVHTKSKEALQFNNLIKNYKTLLSSRVFLGFNLCGGIAMGMSLVYTTISPFLFQLEYHFSPVSYGWLGFSIGIAGIIGKLASAMSLKYSGINKNISIGLAIYLLSGLLLAFASLYDDVNVRSIIGLILFCTLGQGFITANAMAMSMSQFRELGGSAGALYGTITYLVGFLSSACLTLLHSYSAFVLGVSYVVLACFGMVFFWYGRSTVH